MFERIVMKTIGMKAGKYSLSNSILLPTLDVGLVGEPGTILVPESNVLAVSGIGNDDVRCSDCSYILAMNIKRQQLQKIAIKCPSCGNINLL